MLSAAERVVMNKARCGFVSERDLNQSQIRTAKELLHRGLLVGAGQEPDRTKVYRLTPKGDQEYAGGL